MEAERGYVYEVEDASTKTPTRKRSTAKKSAAENCTPKNKRALEEVLAGKYISRKSQPVSIRKLRSATKTNKNRNNNSQYPSKRRSNRHSSVVAAHVSHPELQRSFHRPNNPENQLAMCLLLVLGAELIMLSVSRSGVWVRDLTGTV